MAERNPYHLPKGTPEGGQFTSAQLDAIAGAARIGAGLMKNKYGRKNHLLVVCMKVNLFLKLMIFHIIRKEKNWLWMQ
jgi:hypothetical protein